MNVFESVLSAFSNVYSHKMRSVLTMLGIIIGISSVITIVSLGAGLKGSVYTVINTISSNAIVVQPMRIEKYEDLITVEDMEAVKAIRDVEYVSAITSNYGSRVEKRTKGEYTEGQMAGVDDNYRHMQEFRMLSGRFISRNDVENYSYVAVIYEKTALEVFGRLDVIGEKISVETWAGPNEYMVVGIIESSDNGMQMVNMPITDAVAIVPYTTLNEVTYSAGVIEGFLVTTNDVQNADKTTLAITNMLAARHQNKDGYYAESIQNFTGQVDGLLLIVTGFVSFVAGISLFVGGVGVMNIMLVTVTERTREIGIRKSLGATNGNIKFQFLLEAMVITAIGGVIGIFFGMGLSSVLGKLITILLKTNFRPETSMLAVGIAFGVSNLVGILSGVYPAAKAAKLDPIEALRYE